MKRAIAAIVLLAGFGGTTLAATNWTSNVTTSAVGGHILGNPDAPTQLVEYISYTCSHCADYTEQSDNALKQGYVASGKVSVEVRNFFRDPVDLTAALLARCGAPSKFFGNHKALMTSQSTWLPKVVAAPQSEQEKWYEGPYESRFKLIAERAGFYAIMQKRGYSRSASDTCLANEPARKRIFAMTVEGKEKYQVAGTPSFLIDEKLQQNVHSWTTLKPLLPTQ